jgi:hypothetical protein
MACLTEPFLNLIVFKRSHEDSFFSGERSLQSLSRMAGL